MNFQNAMVAEGNHGGIFQEIWRGFEWISNSSGGGRKLWGIFQEMWRRFAWTSKSSGGGRKLWGDFSRNVEKVWVDFQKQWWRKEIMGEFFGEKWRGFAWISKKQYWREETMGELFKNLGEGLREYTTAILAG